MAHWRIVAVAVLAAGVAGCGGKTFPTRPVTQCPDVAVYDTNQDGLPDYWQHIDDSGQKVELVFDTDHDGHPDRTVCPRELDPSDRLHVILVLDGVPFEVIDRLYRDGLFRLFPPPSRVVSVFPAMTDLALAQAFTDQTCPGYEALYFDRARNAASNGAAVYLKGANEPWRHDFDYQCSPWLDAMSYLDPRSLWHHEMAGIEKMINRHETGTVRAYSVATAGLGTRGGRPAIEQYLREVDRFCERLTHERQGRITFTLMADHGHDLVPAVRAPLEGRLRDDGYRPAKKLKDNACMFLPSFGLVSCAVLYTKDAPDAATAVIGEPAVDLAMYRAAPGDEASPIVVRSKSGTARIERTATGFAYRDEGGDPLHLGPIIERLREAGDVAPDGSVADRAWFQATADHVYPDPLWRIWLAFNGLVQNPADVILSLHEGYCAGSRFFSTMITVASTHGALTRRSSVTFAMSNANKLPPLLRTADLATRVRKATD